MAFFFFSSVTGEPRYPLCVVAGVFGGYFPMMYLDERVMGRITQINRDLPYMLDVLALSVGAGFASLLGAGVLTWAKSGGTITLPGVGELVPWQATFFIVGLPGLILSVLFFLLREPSRSGGPSATGGSLPDMLKHVLAFCIGI